MTRQTDAPHLDARRATIEIRGFDDLRMITSISVNVDTFNVSSDLLKEGSVRRRLNPESRGTRP
jgi:hypothetical protein